MHLYRMWRNITGQALYQLAVLAVLVIYGAEKLDFLGVDTTNPWIKTTIIFNTFVFCQVFNEINSRMLGDGTNTSVSLFLPALIVLFL